jgi:RNA polymerase sigma factor (sigma-70 family)
MNASRDDLPDSKDALEQLCQAYWPAIYSYIRRRGHDRDHAKDLTQDFFMHLLERNSIAVADPAKGKFRSFLLGSVNHFLANEWQRVNAQKRGGGKVIVSFDNDAEHIADPIATDSPEMAFDRHWAFTLLKRGMIRLEEEYKRSGKERHYQMLNRFLTERTAEQDYAAVASEMQTNPATVAVWVHRMRQQYRDMVRSEIAETVSCSSEVDEEMRYLLSTLT